MSKLAWPEQNKSVNPHCTWAFEKSSPFLKMVDTSLGTKVCQFTKNAKEWVKLDVHSQGLHTFQNFRQDLETRTLIWEFVVNVFLLKSLDKWSYLAPEDNLRSQNTRNLNLFELDLSSERWKVPLNLA